ncbi:PEP-CTERM sorting domain-containing protein [Persicirhabdus sediminis]|uniref:PEP-CTERM sorting domain-containing protein n=1 Tax=Persicirhabdus sediminis TaxID=454144 RepID=A0A8J7MEM1_9BACT|nr:PEP-CTERM sorting domain-containing protein [Persicirhabdus sediminis]MBK1791577.1 PEP-CTERM sorting domain-containing protein [Persicirhabdus sediminis]
MKKLILASTAVLASAALSHAAVVTFGSSSSNSLNWSDGRNTATIFNTTESNGSITFTTIQDGVTFELNIQGYTVGAVSPEEKGISIFGNGQGIGVVGGSSGSANNRISNNASGDTADDEFVRYTLTVSGAEVSQLSLSNVEVRYLSKSEDKVFFSDGSSTATFTTGEDFSYATNLGSLDALTATNVSTWYLDQGMIDADSPNNLANAVTAIGSVEFNYEVVPEPSAVALLGLGGLALILRKRR